MQLPDNESSLKVPLTNVRVDNEYNLRILTHFPPPDYTAYDSENPQVKGHKGVSMVMLEKIADMEAVACRFGTTS